MFLSIPNVDRRGQFRDRFHIRAMRPASVGRCWLPRTVVPVPLKTLAKAATFEVHARRHCLLLKCTNSCYA
jgi:hypothetical protein